MKSNDKSGIDTADITERLVGITPTYLNNFVQRGTFGLKASIQRGEVRAQRRLYNEADVFGIALVWLLFESGFRTDPIIRILKDIGGTKRPEANLAAWKLQQARATSLVIVRKPRRPSKNIAEKPEQVVILSGQAEVAAIASQNTDSCLAVVPVGSKFQDVRRRIDILF